MKKRIFVMLALLLFLLPGCSIFKNQSGTNDIPSYGVKNLTTYIKNGKQCVQYDIVVTDNTTEDEMIAIFNDVTDDNYYLHKIYFYGENIDIDVIRKYTVGKMEEKEKGVVPQIQPPTISAKKIQQLRDK